MRDQLLPGLRIMLFMTMVFGLAYPLAITGLSQWLFPYQANGSLVKLNGKVIGSALIGQNFTRPEYFHPRPSAAGAGYDAASSGGSNFGPTSRVLMDRVKARIQKFRADNPGYHGLIPADLVTASGSGLDPDISPDSARAQAARVARARGASLNRIDRLINRHTAPPALGFIGEPRVNVLELNLALDRDFPLHP